MVVTDGGSGLGAALKACWPETRIQRCLVHVQRNIRTYLTRNPRTEAGKALWALGKTLTKVDTPDAARAWLINLHTWHQVYAELTRQRTWRDHVGDDASIPSWTRPGQKWWYTHDKLRKAYRLLQRLTRENVLFTYLDPDLVHCGIAATTNQIEGGVNAQLRRTLAAHRGMTSDHQRRTVEWWLYQHSENPRRPTDLIHSEHSATQSSTSDTEEAIGPAGYDTATSAEEGLWARKGWAGHT